jgi:hypothetical protein
MWAYTQPKATVASRPLAQAFGLWPAHANRVLPARDRHRSGHGGEPTADSMTVKILNPPRGNSHWISAYMLLQENLVGEAGKGVLTEGGTSTVTRVPTERRYL